MKAAWIAVACAAVGCGKLAGPSQIDSVRILAIAADTPYAAPGATVMLNALAVDGRADRSTPMTVYWLPAPCVDPRGDAYFACYPALAALPAGQDLTSRLVAGPSWSFTVPLDVLSKHAADPSYGVAYAFAIACAGHVQYVPPPAGAPANALPLGCFDAAGAALPPDDYVFAFAPIYAFADGRTNANPVIDHVELAGAPIDPVAGLSIDHCDASAARCGAPALSTVVPDASWQLDPADVDADGATLHEAITADYFLTQGSVANDTVALFDPRTGRLPDPGDKLTAPDEPGDSTLWVVVHDNRGGASWLQLPVHAE